MIQTGGLKFRPGGLNPSSPPLTTPICIRI